MPQWEDIMQRHVSVAAAVLGLWIGHAVAQETLRCQAKGYRVSATVVDKDGVTVVQLRGDGASPHTMENSTRKA
jgi:uncharacterized protein GlcG (DUF336 family)